MSTSGLLATLLAVPLLALPARAAPPSSAAAADPCASPTIVGTSGDDTLTGTAGPDVIDGRGGTDEISGGDGDDVLCGDGGHDFLEGGDGDDRLYGGRDGWVDLEEVGYWDGDTLDGGPGDDLLDAGHDPRPPSPKDILVFAGSASGVEVDLPAGTATGDGSDVLVGQFRAVQGSDHDDHLIGADLGETLVGGPGADVIDGGPGDDDIYTGEDSGYEDPSTDGAADVADGGSGNDWMTGDGNGDVLAGGGGNDHLSGIRARQLLGGAGNDHLRATVARSGSQVFRGGPGRDEVSLRWPARWHGTPWQVLRGRVELVAGVARFQTKQGAVRVAVEEMEGAAVTASGRWTVVGTPGRNVLDVDTGGNRAAVLIGLGGNDVLRGTQHADLLRGGPGFDVAWGRGGRDRYSSVERRR